LFWKKNNQNDEITVNIETHTQRQSFRVKSSKSFPIIALIHTKKYLILDLSAGGLSFSSTDFLENDILNIQLKLPIVDVILHLTIQVLNISKNTINQCKFLNLTDDDSDIIHKFIMDYQKIELRKKKDLRKAEILNKQKMVQKKKHIKKKLQKETTKQKKIQQF